MNYNKIERKRCRVGFEQRTKKIKTKFEKKNSNKKKIERKKKFEKKIEKKKNFKFFFFFFRKTFLRKLFSQNVFWIDCGSEKQVFGG